MQEQDRGGDLLKEAPSLRQAELAGTGDEVCRFPSVVPKRISLSYSLNLLFPAFSKVLPPNRETEKDVLRKKKRLPPCSQDLPGLCPVSALPSSSATATAILFHLFFSPGKKKQVFFSPSETPSNAKFRPGPAQDSDSASVTVEAMEVLASSGDPKSADVFFQRALAINETTHGIGHPLTLASVVDCSRILQHLKKYEEASVLCRMELARAEKASRDRHVNVAPLLAEFADVTRKCGRHREAAALLWRELELRERIGHSSEIVCCLIRLCKSLRRSHEVGKATSVVRRALKVAQTKLGVSHLETVSVQCHLAETLHMNRFGSRNHDEGQPCEEALVLYQEASRVLQQLNPRHPLAEKVSKGLQRELECCSKDSAAGPAAVELDGRRRMAEGLSSKFNGERTVRWPKATSRSTSAPASSPFLSNNEPLPRGWKVKKTPTGRIFFVNRQHRKTTWVDPRLLSAADENPSNDLPPGWEKAVDTDGEVYYIDHNTRATQRKPPTGPFEDAVVDDVERVGRQSDVRESRGSWGSIGSVLSSVSSLTRSVSSASISSLSNSIMTAKNMFGRRGDVDATGEPGQLTAHIWSSLGWNNQTVGGSLLPMYVGEEQRTATYTPQSGGGGSVGDVVDL